MTDRNDQPDWDLLPANPRGFFTLPAEFERKELKRAYNRLLRMFKPERHPAEFQRIRAAFEELDLELRYGYSGASATQNNAAYQWPDSAASQERATSEGAPSSEKQQSLALHERLDNESPQDLYSELADRPHKDPYDYFGLAILSDVVDRKDPLQFARWLLQGLKEHPGDPGLLHLLRDYLRDYEVSPALPKLLIACSMAVPNDNFYPLTEAAWENLLREEPFDACLVALKKCQANLRDIGIAGQIVFAIRVLRFALWRDQTDWKDQALDLVEENFEQIPAHMEFELEILTAAQRYLATRDQFLNGDPLRQQIDEAMQSYFILDQVEGDRQVLQCQLGMLDNSEQLLAAFSPSASSETDEVCQTMYTLWDWISADVGERYGIQQQDDINTDLWLTRTVALLKQCRAHTKASAGGWRWQIAEVVMSLTTGSLYIVVPTVLCLMLTLGAISIFPDEGESILMIVVLAFSIGGGLYFARQISKQIRKRFWEPYCERKARRNYQRFWRREVIDFLDRSQLPFHLTTQLLAHSSREDLDTWVCHFTQQDYGLAMFATARRFLT